MRQPALIAGASWKLSGHERAGFGVLRHHAIRRAFESALISIRSSLDIQAAARAGVKALGLGARQSGKSQKLAPPAIAGWLRRRG